jgi:Primase C terminal 2 (PriCT-2)/TOTE conflict system, Archaeo-Eukaryotic Primase domain
MEQQYNSQTSDSSSETGNQNHVELYRLARKTPAFASAPNQQPAAEKAAWQRNSELLADWVLAHLVSRIDRYGSYRKVLDQGGVVVRGTMVPESLTKAVLMRHFSSAEIKARVGIYLVRPDNETTLVTVIDIDAHGPDDDAEANWQFAKFVAKRAITRNVSTLLFDSNGRGGYHVWCVHDQQVPMADSYRFGKYLVSEWENHGLKKQPESFPKSPRLTNKRIGHMVRLPGKHHKRDHWTRVWDGVSDDRESGLLCGQAAIELILQTGTSGQGVRSFDLVPAEFRLPGEVRPAQGPPRAMRQIRVDSAKLDQDAILAREALEYLMDDLYDDYDKWIQVGMALRQLGDQGLQIWHEWSARSKKYDPDVLEAKWESFVAATESSSNRDDLISLGSVFKLAGEHGWRRPGTKEKPKTSWHGTRRRWSRRQFTIKFSR